jgi:hypothetical protein
MFNFAWSCTAVCNATRVSHEEFLTPLDCDEKFQIAVGSSLWLAQLTVAGLTAASIKYSSKCGVTASVHALYVPLTAPTPLRSEMTV